MSEENKESMVAPERSVSPKHLHSSHRKASVSGSFRAGNDAKRGSTGKSNSANSIQITNSRYLRASTGSCHDFCKFGHRHSSEEKTRAPLSRRISKPSPVKANAFGPTLEEQKKVKILNREPPSNTKAQSTPYMKSELLKTKSSLVKKASSDSINDHRKPKTYSDVETPFSRQTSTPLLKNNPSSTKKDSSQEIIKSVIFPSEKIEAKLKCGPLPASEIPRYGRLKASPSVKSNPVNVKRAVRPEKSDVVPHATSQHTKRLAPPASSLIPKASLSKAGSNRLIKAGNLKPVSLPMVEDNVSGDNGNTSNGKLVLEKTLHIIKTEAALPDDHIILSFPSPSPSRQSGEGDNKEIEYCEKSVEIDKVMFIPDAATISSISQSPKSVSQAESSSSSLCPHEEVDNDICNVGSLEMCEELSLPIHAVSSLPSSPKSLLQAVSSPYCMEDDEEIEALCKEPGEITLSNEKHLETDKMESIRVHPKEPHKCISENDKSPEIGNSLFTPEATGVVEYHDGYIPKNDESSETGNLQSSHEVTEGIEDIKDGYNSENDASPDTAILHSIMEDSKGIEYRDNGYTSENDEPQRIGIFQIIPKDEKDAKSCDDGYISGNKESPEIDKQYPVPDSLTVPSSPKSSTDSSLLSYEDNEDDAEYTDSELDECIPEKDENLTSNTLRRARVLISSENHSNPVKLKFRPGRTIDLQSENIGPKRLRFRRRRVVEMENVDGEIKSLKKSGGVNDAGDDETSSERVILKHQDVQDKRDSQVLLNNVIEETASKLAESRKSKVKALVGAFETVISLHETKPGS